MSIYFYGFTPESSFEFINKSSLKFSNSLEDIGDQIKPEATLNILLLHDGFAAGKKIARNLPEIDVVICGHSQEKRSLELENQIILQPGFDGEYLGFLEIEVNGSDKKYKNYFLPINSSYVENRDFRIKLEEYYQRLKTGEVP